MTLLIFIFWILFGLFIIRAVARRASFLLSFRFSAVAFGAKVIAGCFYGYVYGKMSRHPDTWMFYKSSLEETAMLKSDPLRFVYTDILDLNGHQGNIWNTFFGAEKTFFTDLHDNLMIKLMAVLNLLTDNSYYANVVIFNIFIFGASYVLLRFLCRIYPLQKNVLKYIVFFFPVSLFWTSGFHRDGLLLGLLALNLDYFYQLFGVQKFTGTRTKKWLIFIVSFLALLFLRNFWALFFLLFGGIYILSKCCRFVRPVWIFAGCSILAVALFFATDFLPQQFRMPELLAEKQHSFFKVSGTFYLPISPLDGSFYSYFKVLPQGLNHVFLRPYPTEWRGAVNLIAMIGNIGFWGALLLAMLFPSACARDSFNDRTVLLLLFLILSNYAIIGITVPYLSAITRYKSVFEMLFICLCVANVNWEKIRLKYMKKKTNINKN